MKKAIGQSRRTDGWGTRDMDKRGRGTVWLVRVRLVRVRRFGNEVHTICRPAAVCARAAVGATQWPKLLELAQFL